MLLELLGDGHSLGTSCVNVAELERGLRPAERKRARVLLDRLMYFDTPREAATPRGSLSSRLGSPGTNAPYARRAHRGNRTCPRRNRPHRQPRRLPDARPTRRTTQPRIAPTFASAARGSRSSLRTPANGRARVMAHRWHIRCRPPVSAVVGAPALTSHNGPPTSTVVRLCLTFQAGYASSILVTRSRSLTCAFVRACLVANARKSPASSFSSWLRGLATCGFVSLPTTLPRSTTRSPQIATHSHATADANESRSAVDAISRRARSRCACPSRP